MIIRHELQRNRHFLREETVTTIALNALFSYLQSKGYKCTKATTLYNIYELPHRTAGAISQCAAGS